MRPIIGAPEWDLGQVVASARIGEHLSLRPLMAADQEGTFVTFADGWICLACWKPNQRGAERCYRCKAPRGAGPAKATPEPSDPAAQAVESSGAEAVPDIVVAVPAMVFSWMGWIWRKCAVLFLILSVLLAIGDLATGLVGVGIAAVYYLIGLVYRAIANGMRDRALWALLTGVVVAGIPTAAHIYVLFFAQMSPLPAATPDVVATIMGVSVALSWLSLAMNGSAAGCALVGLVLAVVRPSPRRRPSQQVPAG